MREESLERNDEERIEKLLEKDLIKKIYNNNLYLSEYKTSDKEYLKLSQSNVKLSKFILKNASDPVKESFLQYEEQVNIKEGIEAEKQFELGFKTAIKLILEGIK